MFLMLFILMAVASSKRTLNHFEGYLSYPTETSEISDNARSFSTTTKDDFILSICTLDKTYHAP